jgi:hypothetical protein
VRANYGEFRVLSHAGSGIEVEARGAYPDVVVRRGRDRAVEPKTAIAYCWPDRASRVSTTRFGALKQVDGALVRIDIGDALKRRRAAEHLLERRAAHHEHRERQRSDRRGAWS